MNAHNPDIKTPTAKECLSGLETLFNAYKNDSEFNYQLSVSDSPFNILKKIVGEYAKIEEELGVDLVTLFNALKNGYWNKGGYYSDTILNKKDLHFTEPKDVHISFTWYCEKENEDDFDCTVNEKDCLCLHEMQYEDPQYIVRVKDCGKTWALTKEALL